MVFVNQKIQTEKSREGLPLYPDEWGLGWNTLRLELLQSCVWQLILAVSQLGYKDKYEDGERGEKGEEEGEREKERNCILLMI